MKHIVLALLAACGTASPVTSAPGGPAPAAFTPTAFAVKVSGHGQPVIFIPGLGCGGDVWDGTLAHLGGKVEAHVVTLAGFAGQPAIAPPFLPTVRDQIAAYIAANHLVHPIIVGHSLGGMLAIWLAETDPDIAGAIDVDGLPFLGAIGDPNITAAQAAGNAKQMHDALIAMTKDQLVETMHETMTTMITKPADLERMMVDIRASDPGTVATAFAELFSNDLRPKLATISAPLLLVAAADSGNGHEPTAAIWHQQTDAIPHHDLQIVEHARHFVMLDQPEAFYALVDGFLAKTKP